MAEFKLPTETVDLPSKGLLYNEDNPLSSGKVEIKYMTAKEEDILSNSSYIKNGTVLDKLFKSLIVSKIKYNDLLIGDKNAIMVAARVLGYGNDYSFEYNDEKYTLDLSKIEFTKVKEKLWNRENIFDFTLPNAKTNIKIKLLSHEDEGKINREIEGLQKINKNSSAISTTRLKHTIVSVEGETETKKIREFIDNYLLARDARAIRNFIKEIQPDVDLTFFPDRSNEKKNIPIGLSFFWPDVG